MQGLKDRSKTKGLKETSAIMFKLALNTLSTGTILFIDNYFTTPELAEALMKRGIAVYRTIKSNRRDLPKLLMKIKQVFTRDISYGVLATVI